MKRIENIHQELNHYYYLQVIAFQDEPKYQDIAIKLSKNLSELEDVIKDIRKFNINNKNTQLININK